MTEQELAKYRADAINLSILDFKVAMKEDIVNKDYAYKSIHIGF